MSVLESEQLIVREPGRGTFVKDHQAGQALGRFNPIRGADGAPLRGQVRSRKVRLAAPTPAERAALRLQPGDQVVRIQRIRVHDGRPFAYEQAASRIGAFRACAGQAEIPDELEELAQDRGVILARAEAKVKLAPASPAAAQALSLAERTPVLALERIAFDTDHEPIEAMTAYYDLREEYCRAGDALSTPAQADAVAHVVRRLTRAQRWRWRGTGRARWPAGAAGPRSPACETIPSAPGCGAQRSPPCR